MIGRRGFITGLVSLVAAPAIVRVGSIMPVRVMEPEWAWQIPPYGICPALVALPDAAMLADIRERIDQAFLYPLIDAAWRELHLR